jgi:hypothetical protein
MRSYSVSHSLDELRVRLLQLEQAILLLSSELPQTRDNQELLELLARIAHLPRPPEPGDGP